jgi:Na+/melibiose symporter-like transporter
MIHGLSLAQHAPLNLIALICTAALSVPVWTLVSKSTGIGKQLDKKACYLAGCAIAAAALFGLFFVPRNSSAVWASYLLAILCGM